MRLNHCWFILSIFHHVNPPAKRIYGTPGTERRDGSTNILSPRNQKGIILNPKFFGQFFSKGPFGFLRCFCPDIAESIRNTVNVRVNANPQFPETFRHNEIGGFSPHPPQRQKRINIVGNSAVKLFKKIMTNGFNISGFGLIETYGINRLFYFTHA